MRKLGKKQMTLELQEPLAEIPPQLTGFKLDLSADRTHVVYTYDTQSDRTGITTLLGELNRIGIKFKDLHTTQSSLEEIFVSLVRK
jgi:ABC-2 type transport system ATP-binding protein